jgi:outer membrane protein assembly factor BamB
MDMSRGSLTGGSAAVVFLLGAILAGSLARAQSWPQWRGPARAGVTAVLSGWDGSRWNLRKRWQVAVGPGLGGSPIIVDGRIYVMGWGGQGDTVWCLDARDGKTVWKQEYKAPLNGRFQRGESPEGPTCTPTFDKETGYLYTRGNDGDLFCWDTARQGKSVWHINLYDAFKVTARLSTAKTEPFRDYGYTGNVLIYKDWAIMEVGSPQAGNIVAFNKRTGQKVWGSQDRHAAGQSCGPVVMTVQGKPCIASFTLEGLCVMRADAGHEGENVAFFPWTMPYNENMPAPCVSGDTVILTGTPNYGSGKKTTFLKIGLSGILKQWQGQRQSFICSPVAHEGCIYGVSGKVYCLDFATGALRWEGGHMGGETGSVLVTGDDKIIAWGNRHLLLVESARRSPNSYKELASLEEPIADSRGDCYSCAALGEGCLLIKDGSGQLACYVVGSRASRPVPSLVVRAHRSKDGPKARSVPLWGRFETQVSNPRSYANPFTDVTLNAVFTSPSGKRVRFFGFYDGDGRGHQQGNVWKMRFMPDEPGTWSYTCAFSDGAPGAAGVFRCATQGANPGPLRVDPHNRRCWVFADGSRFWPRAYTAPELFVAGNEQHRKYWVDYFFGAMHRFNFCNANLLNFVGVGEALNWQGTPYKAPDPAHDGQFVTITGNGLFPFLYSGPRPRFDGGSNVDWLRPSIPCWANVDRVLRELEARRVVWFNHWGMIGWDWSGNGRLLVPPAARKAVLRYWIARLAPYWNLTWNIAGEWDELFTPAEFDQLGTFIKEADPWKHPLSSHALGATLDRPWVDFRIEQFSAGTSGDAIANARRADADYAGKPVFAFETSWEATPGKLTPDQVRRGAWGSVMGGAFYLYAECFEPTLTWGDGGAFRFIEILHDCFAGLPYWRLAPVNALVNPESLCLADRGQVYVIYRQNGGTITLDLSAATGLFRCRWLDPRTGAKLDGGSVTGGGSRTFRMPGSDDWILLITSTPGKA